MLRRRPGDPGRLPGFGWSDAEAGINLDGSSKIVLNVTELQQKRACALNCLDFGPISISLRPVLQLFVQKAAPRCAFESADAGTGLLPLFCPVYKPLN
ncbi:hypothetical protein PZ897_16945 [Hoeflea sp. YIM 152468]|uniref:hypothetical protein n=1 Tax=Hoeflea sp. YIM 152468 TaxID=3031759 RepID=UPI0023DA0168|nr:hypothetical protein [Hoeflea sp. YIM 152468]MDF1609873.1 hypothetical protein [Hoeflea sp. YIM 152468]